MTWNYRVVNEEGFLGIHEVYYNDNDQPYMVTKVPIGVSGDSLLDLHDTYQLMAEAFDKPVLDMHEIVSVK